MGWLTLVLLIATVAALLLVLRVPRTLWTLVATFLMLGAAGYAWQGEPDLAAHPAEADAVKLPPPPAYTQMRDDLYGRFSTESAYFAIADAQLSEGDTTFAAGVLAGALRALPNDFGLWSELGNVIALHDHAMVSPAALFAFQRAMTIAPQHPGPPYFLGNAYLRAGEFAKARPYWARALALTPAKASYRIAIAARLALLDRILADPRFSQQ
ncbi:MAG: tetratricopeptide repeat protein [Sphingomonas sp.]|uniref:tetratricopeptide repeat protein n=1 Tax=Sphingomonas sp. TaxID=28214 RepID=UPI001AD0E037|nr:tetratricopeptide repeat protein [Sphingomonas sp.]MBN8807705.1 tetratricopeptide repeat protein [Sphingomonas sp.]